MVVTTTGIAFTTIAIGLTGCGLWFLQAARNTNRFEKDKKIGFLLTLFFLGFAIANGAVGVSGIFFVDSPLAMYGATVVSNLALAILSVFGPYTAYYIFFPKKSVSLQMLSLVALAFLTIATTVIEQPWPFLTAQNTIDPNLSPFLSLLMFLVLFFGVGSALYIFTRLFLEASVVKVKMLALIIALLALGGVVHAFIRYVLLSSATAGTRSLFQDVSIGVMGVVFLTAFIIQPFLKRLFSKTWK